MTSAPSIEGGNHVIFAGDQLNEIAAFEANGVKGGTVEIDIIFERNGTAVSQPVVINFG